MDASRLCWIFSSFSISGDSSDDRRSAGARLLDGSFIPLHSWLFWLRFDFFKIGSVNLHGNVRVPSSTGGMPPTRLCASIPSPALVLSTPSLSLVSDEDKMVAVHSLFLYFWQEICTYYLRILIFASGQKASQVYSLLLLLLVFIQSYFWLLFWYAFKLLYFSAKPLIRWGKAFMAKEAEELLSRQLRLLSFLDGGQKLEVMLGDAENSFSNYWKYQVLGMTVPKLIHSLNQILGTLRKIVGIQESDVTWMQLPDGTFVIRFRNELDMKRMFAKQPLVVYNYLILITTWDGVTPPQRLIIDEFDCWVQLHLSNPLYLTTELATELYKKVGTVIPQEDKKSVFIVQGIARAKLRIKSSEPLRPMVGLVTSKGVSVVANVKFERLKSACYICGHVSHGIASCFYRNLPQFKDLKNEDFKLNRTCWGPFLFVPDWSPNQATLSMGNHQDEASTSSARNKKYGPPPAANPIIGLPIVISATAASSQVQAPPVLSPVAVNIPPEADKEKGVENMETLAVVCLEQSQAEEHANALKRRRFQLDINSAFSPVSTNAMEVSTSKIDSTLDVNQELNGQEVHKQQNC